MFKIVKDDKSKDKKVFKFDGNFFEPQMNANSTIKTIKTATTINTGTLSKNEITTIILSDNSKVTNPNNCHNTGTFSADNHENCYYYFDEFTPT